MNEKDYYFPLGGLQPRSELLSSKATFKDAYMVMPASVMSDIVTSQLPFFIKSRFWVLARPMTGFSETFSQYIGEIEPSGGSERPENDKRAEAVFFVTDGALTIVLEGEKHVLHKGGFAYLPAGHDYQLFNEAKTTARFHWIRKAYEKVEGLDKPDAIFSSDQQITPAEMKGHEGVWMTSRFMDMNDMRHDMNVAIVTFMPGAHIPFMETHVMEHGLYVLQGKGVYRLNDDWVEVEKGDFMWLRAFCPQACYAGGPEPFRYLLYKDINRHAKLW
ncbi:MULTISPECIES: bifunctional allantoicase/(S)-ureidoglycine aminohydrolase [Bartonella]|uniref:(S)-ureidoglycine aminohydrolase n=1 Tax=Bartonella apis TaxID=1686310 RepID=A0A1R0FA86_9HYPH|nr:MULTISPECIES: bifunctional allantoicase/(S)-ureidoglycine aminohydrolase [Bartonella]MCT6919954.1 bifunctional allantoicase/(S)-ureidoglycine aminohydrolase [Bifidobacteriales bacterium]MBH9987530.1 (S)-ureidoglycine aminohydrolase [Bartonella apis]MBI0171461.1 (S)-ureidoglycine aminohydrolase [Bartonella sp. W8151]MCT6825456.1 bifunctional allantoicase/(S)-ureidoglycine aminohydrolase [Bartonella apis]OLY43812.1 (S)-ureidoglycine aminohydrolase [Bartonella apis]